jgi:hypothetical protein
MIPQVHLEEYSKELDAEIKSTEEKIRSLQSKLADLQTRRAAVSYLGQTVQQGTGRNTNGNPSSGSRATHWATSTHPHRRTVGNGPREQTLYTEYDKPLLESLVGLGGKGSAEEVLRSMKLKMGPILKPKDFDVVSSGEERWRNTARWRRNALLKLGFLRADSARGVWEISASGEAWLKQAR